MGKDWKYILYVGGAIVLFVVVQLMSPKQYDWTVTYSHDDKNPFGAFALYELMPTIFKEGKIDHHFKTIYEVKESLKEGQNIFILASDFEGDKPDTEFLLKHVEKGGHVFISANYFRGVFRDTLQLRMRDYFLDDVTSLNKDSSSLKLSNSSLDTLENYWFAKNNVTTYFNRFDTVNTTVMAENSYGHPVTIRVKRGKGSFILNSTPLAFTNIYLLSSNNNEFISSTLSALPDRDVSWTEYYHIGRMESGSPLRFILTEEPLAWAYYITIGAILIFMVFEAKRKQRIIPIVKPLQNTSLEFVSTIGNLYYQNGDHKNIAEKKIAFLLDFIRTNYLVRTTTFNEEFYEIVSRKSGHSIDEVRDLFKSIIFINSSTMISPEQLMSLNKKIEQFFRTESSK
jgi:hypothetical protein